MEIKPTEARDKWNATFAEFEERQFQIRYRCPECSQTNVINVAFGVDESEVATQLWCHRSSIGADVTLGPLEATP